MVSPGRLDEAHGRQRGDALAAAGLADDAERLAVLDLEADPVDGLDHPVLGEEVGLEPLDLEEIVGLGSVRAGPASFAGVVVARRSTLDPLARVEGVAQAVAEEAGATARRR